jgi:hypothetical protein
MAVSGVILTIVFACSCWCVQCCCLPTSKTAMRGIIGFVIFVVTLVFMLLAFIFVFFAFQGGSKSVNGILNVGCAAQSMV